MSERETARQFGLAWETVRKMMRYSVPPGYRRQQPVKRPKRGPWMASSSDLQLPQGRHHPGDLPRSLPELAAVRWKLQSRDD